VCDLVKKRVERCCSIFSCFFLTKTLLSRRALKRDFVGGYEIVASGHDFEAKFCNVKVEVVVIKV